MLAVVGAVVWPDTNVPPLGAPVRSYCRLQQAGAHTPGVESPTTAHHCHARKRPTSMYGTLHTTGVHSKQAVVDMDVPHRRKESPT